MGNKILRSLFDPYLRLFSIVMVLSLEGGKLEEDRRLILLAFVLRFVAEFLQAFYSVGGASYGLCAGIYYVLTALAVCYCYYEARRRDDPEKIHADHIQWKQHRRLR